MGASDRSPLLPAGLFGSHEVDGKGRPLAERLAYRRDYVEVFLARNGHMLEKLVHRPSIVDGPDSKTGFPDECLGETSEKMYRWAYPLVVDRLRWLKEKARQMSLATDS